MNILVTKINFLGDAVSFLPTLDGLCRTYPEARITLLCSTGTRSLFERSIDGIEVVSIDFLKTRGKVGLLTAFREFLALRRHHYDIALHAYDEPSFSYLLSKLLSIPRRIGFDSGIARTSFLLTETLPFDASRNVVDINFDLVRSLAPSRQLSPKRIPVATSDQELAKIDELLEKLGFSNNLKLVLIHPSAKQDYKRWGDDRFIALAKELEERCSAFVVFLSEYSTDAFPRCISQISIHELSALLSRAQLFIGNNSGPMHVAAATGTATLVARGPSHPSWDVYWTDRYHANVSPSGLSCAPCDSLKNVLGRCTNRQEPMACMRQITTSKMLQEAAKMLNQSAQIN